MITNRGNCDRNGGFGLEDDLRIGDFRGEMGVQVFKQFGFGSDRGVPDSWDKILAFVEDTQQIYNVGLTDVVHFVFFKSPY